MDRGFFQKHSRAIARLCRLIDIFLIITAGCFAHYLKFGTFLLSVDLYNALLMSILLSFIVFEWLMVYAGKRGQSLTREIINVVFAWSIVLLILTLLAYMSKMGESVSREWAIISSISAVGLMCLFRVSLRVCLSKIRSEGWNTRNAVIYGAGNLGQLIAQKLKKETWAGINCIGFFDDEVEEVKNADGLPVWGRLEELSKMIEDGRTNSINQSKIDQVWIALPLTAQARINEVVKMLQNTPVQIQFVLDSEGTEIFKYPTDQFAGIPILNMSVQRLTGTDAIIKNLFDKVFASTVLFFIWPIMLIIMLLIKLESQGDAIFKQARYGVDGKQIEIWKFRSMNVTEDSDDIIQTQKQDSRVTKVGQFIRKWSLDELPQFINVLQGSMSVVGPRPHAVLHNEYYRQHISKYMSRHVVKPGITGWAQVNGWRGQTETDEKMQQRVKFDLDYISNWSLRLDLKIIFWTIFRGLSGENVY